MIRHGGSAQREHVGELPRCESEPCRLGEPREDEEADGTERRGPPVVSRDAIESRCGVPHEPPRVVESAMVESAVVESMVVESMVA